MGKFQVEIRKKIVKRLKKGPANVTLLSEAAGCTRQTARIHVTELERDMKVKSEDLGNQRVYWIDGHRSKSK